MLKGDSEEQLEEDLTLVICRNIMALFGWVVGCGTIAVSWELWEKLMS
jgi:hypothetical protein